MTEVVTTLVAAVSVIVATVKTPVGTMGDTVTKEGKTVGDTMDGANGSKEGKIPMHALHSLFFYEVTV